MDSSQLSPSEADVMGRDLRNWLTGMAFLGLAVFAYMLIHGEEGSWSLQEEIARTDIELMKERSLSS